MNFKRVFAITKKEFIHIRRDARSMALAFLIPLILILLFGYALTLDIKNIKTTVVDYDKSTLSRNFINKFEKSGYFNINSYANSLKEAEENIYSGKSMVAIIIPLNFEKKINSNQDVKVQTIIDGSNANKASAAYGYINSISEEFSIKILTEEKILTDIELPLETDIRVWYNENLESKNFIIPGLIAVIMLIIASLLASQVVSREWENGTMEQLIVSPIKPVELIIGKIIPYFAIGMIDLTMIVVMGKALFNIYLKGSLLLLFLLSSLFMIGALGMGITISIIAKNQLVSYQLALLISFLPSYILSGLVFPISSMPKVIQYITYLIPAKYFIVILRGIFLKSNTFIILAMDVLYLGIFAILMFIVANFSFVKKLD